MLNQIDPLDPVTFKVSALVRAARAGMRQDEFGKFLGSFSQSQISKYESGGVDPPAAVIEQCMRIVAERRSSGGANRDQAGLIAQVERLMSTPELNQVALGLSLILAGLQPRAASGAEVSSE
jgi:transcriptional regulator with XRE-family HTH domain